MSSIEDNAGSTTTDDELERMSTASSEFSIISNPDCVHKNVKEETEKSPKIENISTTSNDEQSSTSSASSSFSLLGMASSPTKSNENEIETERVPEPSAFDELSPKIKNISTTSNDELSPKIKNISTTSNDELSPKIKNISTTSNDELSRPSSASSSFSLLGMASSPTKSSENKIETEKVPEPSAETAAKLNTVNFHLSNTEHDFISPLMAIEFSDEIIEAHNRGEDLGDVFIRMDDHMRPQGLFWPVKDPKSEEENKPIGTAQVFTPEDIKKKPIEKKRRYYYHPKKLKTGKQCDSALDSLCKQREALTSQLQSICDRLAHHTREVKELSRLMSESSDKLFECKNKIKNYSKNKIAKDDSSKQL